MKGKRRDNEYLSQFIADCVSENIISSENMCSKAISLLDEIDSKIKEVEELKLIRSKIIYVISVLSSK